MSLDERRLVDAARAELALAYAARGCGPAVAIVACLVRRPR